MPVEQRDIHGTRLTVTTEVVAVTGQPTVDVVTVKWERPRLRGKRSVHEEFRGYCEAVLECIHVMEGQAPTAMGMVDFVKGQRNGNA